MGYCRRARWMEMQWVYPPIGQCEDIIPHCRCAVSCLPLFYTTTIAYIVPLLYYVFMYYV